MGDEDTIEAEEQLALTAGDERLPWLESDDDDEPAGVDTGRIVVFALVGVVVLGVILGAVWMLTRDVTGGEAIVADGSTIEAPDEPYKTRPADPGGREVEGTGQTSFEVAEGETVEGRIAVPEPSIDREQASTPSATASPAPSASPTAASGGVGVQVGAYASRVAAEAGWGVLSGRIGALQGRSHRIVQGTVDGSTVYRLQAVAGTLDDANALCRAIKSEGGDCQVKR